MNSHKDFNGHRDKAKGLVLLVAAHVLTCLVKTPAYGTSTACAPLALSSRITEADAGRVNVSAS